MTLDELQKLHAAINSKSQQLEKSMLKHYDCDLPHPDKHIQLIQLISKSTEINIKYKTLIDIFPFIKKEIHSETSSVLADIYYDWALHLKGTAIFYNHLSREKNAIPYNNEAIAKMAQAVNLYKEIMDTQAAVFNKKGSENKQHRTPQQNYEKASSMLTAYQQKTGDEMKPSSTISLSEQNTSIQAKKAVSVLTPQSRPRFFNQIPLSSLSAATTSEASVPEAAGQLNPLSDAFYDSIQRGGFSNRKRELEESSGPQEKRISTAL